MAILWLAAGLTAEVWAQEALRALVKKCETDNTVTMNIVKRKNKAKELVRTIITIRIQNNEPLVKQFIEAFRKDEQEATRVIEDRQGGNLYKSFFRFEGGTTYNIEINNGNASVSVIERYGKEDNDDDLQTFLHFDDTNPGGVPYLELNSSGSGGNDSGQ
jgi:hypothetical protein